MVCVLQNLQLSQTGKLVKVDRVNSVLDLPSLHHLCHDLDLIIGASLGLVEDLADLLELLLAGGLLEDLLVGHVVEFFTDELDLLKVATVVDVIIR